MKEDSFPEDRQPPDTPHESVGALPIGERPPVDPAGSNARPAKAIDASVLAESRSRTRRSFVVAGAATAAAYGLYQWLGEGPGDEDSGDPLRKALRFNEGVSKALLRDAALAPTYPLGLAENLRVNGVYGLKKELKTEHWRLQLVGMQDAARDPRHVNDVTAWQYRYSGASEGDQGHDTKVDPGRGAQSAAAKTAPENTQAKAVSDENRSRGKEEAGESDSTLKPGTPGLLLQLADIAQLPRHELVTQFKCIEGWSQIVHWAGVRMVDFLDRYPPAPIDGRPPRYVYMETPDGDYYCGYDMHVMRHPQTLLVTEMMGQPLTQFHGAPLRLHMPTKYGYKQIKRIGLIAYTDDRPDDYWTKLGYDWYAGL